jgi:hypothetical protein
MSSLYLDIRELAAWGFDEPVDRGSLAVEQIQNTARSVCRKLAEREPYRAESPIVAGRANHSTDLLATRKKAVTDSGEFDGLAWELAVVDLRKLVAFQRRIAFAGDRCFQIEQDATWLQLLDLALPMNPPSRNPFIEVALYSGRWFLRDGYHRSFRLLNQGMSRVPSVVVYAETLAQMGAVGSQFFSEEILFSERPPKVTDFLDDKLVLRYSRLRLMQIPQGLNKPVQAGCCNQEGL